MQLGCCVCHKLECAEFFVQRLVLLGLWENRCKMTTMVLYLRSSILSQDYHELVLQLRSAHNADTVVYSLQSPCQSAEVLQTVVPSYNMYYNLADSKVALVASIISRPFAFPHWKLEP